MKKFEMPELNVLSFEIEDILTASPITCDFDFHECENELPIN